LQSGWGGFNEIYDGQKNGTFPQSVPLGKRTVAWVESEIETWIARRIAVSPQTNAV
jgi:prophage regulatory protein